MADIPSFITRDPIIIRDEIKAEYESWLGREIQPGQVEQLITNVIAYREVLLLERFNAGMAQMLYQFSNAPILDYIAALVSVERLPAAHAGCLLRFVLVPTHGAVVLPGGTRVSTADGKAIFETNDDVSIPMGVETVDVVATAQTPGLAANNIEIGKVTTILDPIAWVSTVTNITVSGGGSDIESDASLRERIKLAPHQYTTAGSRQSYIYHAKSANAAIIDVSVFSFIFPPAPLITLPVGTLVATADGVFETDDPIPIVPGKVCIVPLADTNDYTQILANVYDTCSPENVRPLCDTVIVAKPEPIYYNIKADVVVKSGEDTLQLKARIDAALKDFTTTISKKLGTSVIRTQLACICRVTGVYDVDMVSPAANVTVMQHQYPVCTGIVVNVTGIQ